LALGGQDVIFRLIIKTDNMKTVLEQLMELKDKISAIEIAVCGETICSDGACGCGCDESPVEVEDEGPEIDSAGFSKEDRVIDGQYMVTEDNKYAGHVHLTRAEMIDFATRLTERVIASVKEAVSNTDLNVDDLVTLELNSWTNNTIEMELDKDTLTNNINSEIEDAICLDVDSINDEIDDIFGDMYLERIS
jgi:L-cysteine desulfidase